MIVTGDKHGGDAAYGCYRLLFSSGNRSALLPLLHARDRFDSAPWLISGGFFTSLASTSTAADT